MPAWNKGKHHSEEVKKKISLGGLGLKRSEETKRKISEARKGNKNPMFGTISPNRGKSPSLEIRKRSSELAKLRVGEKNPRWKGGKPKCGTCNKQLKTYAAKFCSLHKIILRGDKNHNWKGGVTPVNLKIRLSSQSKDWRIAVFERDKYVCQFCGQWGGKLNAHHIRPFALFPNLRFDISNGITLCEGCHATTPRFGNGSKDIFSKIKVVDILKQ